MKIVLFASTNAGKTERFWSLVARADLNIDLRTPTELGLDAIDVVEDGRTLAENAERKARTYFGKTKIPILANDTGFWTASEGFVEAPKRHALAQSDGQAVTDEEISDKLLQYWQGVAKRNGGTVDAAWVEAFIVLFPDGSVRTAESRREVLLTDTVFGEAHMQMPIRALYVSKITNKPAVLHSKKEEWLEMQPVVDVLRSVLATTE